SISLTHSISLSTQLGQPVQIVAAPGLSDSEFRELICLESALASSNSKLILLRKEQDIRYSICKRTRCSCANSFGVRVRLMLFSLNRVPTGRLVLELPAGMLVDDKSASSLRRR
ncbi:uncharacterized protein LOC111290556, partial [Durio zibethinus]|uniref:Uncharacterized protein LOC111290556 n=1 Tax=Durio zibethinus TaxID=66656 RepID=A0A6P5YB07_DURZI